MPQGPTKIGSLRCSRAQPLVGKEDWVNGSIGCPTRQSLDAIRVRGRDRETGAQLETTDYEK